MFILWFTSTLNHLHTWCSRSGYLRW